MNIHNQPYTHTYTPYIIICNMEQSYHVLHSDKLPYFETVFRGKEDVLIEKEMEGFKQAVESENKNELMLNVFESLTSTKESLFRVIEGLEGEKDEYFVKEMVSVESELKLVEESRVLILEEARLISKLAIEVETKVDKYKELRRKEKRELENSLISLTEENRDINNLFRVALLEKEGLEKRIKGHDHKRIPLLQFAELGLQKVGFGFMRGSANSNSNEQSTDTTSEANISDSSSECELEVISLVSSCYL